MLVVLTRLLLAGVVVVAGLEFTVLVLLAEVAEEEDGVLVVLLTVEEGFVAVEVAGVVVVRLAEEVAGLVVAAEEGLADVLGEEDCLLTFVEPVLVEGRAVVEGVRTTLD